MRLGAVTELVGEAGSGKTQLCLQLAVNAFLSHPGGGQTLILDCDGRLCPERLVEMCPDHVDHKALLDSVLILRCRTLPDLCSAVDLLMAVVRERKGVKLVVVDSIAWHFRCGWEGDYLARTGVMFRIVQQLHSVAGKRGVAAVVTNHMTTRIENGTGSGEMVPALGDSWRSAVTCRMVMRYDRQEEGGGGRSVELDKCPWSRTGRRARVVIREEGIRDIEEEEEPRSKKLKS